MQERIQGASGAGQHGCFAPTPVSALGVDRSDVRLPDGNDTDSNCGDFTVTNHPTPGAANQGISLDPGPLVSLQATNNGASSGYLKHDDSDDLVVVAPVTASSSSTDKQDATFVEAAGLANPSCVSFESINKPGSCGTRISSSTCKPTTAARCSPWTRPSARARQQRSGHLVPVGELPRQVHPQLQQRRLPRRQRRRQPLGHRHRLAGGHKLTGGRAVGTATVRHQPRQVKPPHASPRNMPLNRARHRRQP